MDKYPSLPTSEAMERFERERLENGYVFPLRATSAGMDQQYVARIRRLTSVDEAVLNTLPDALQRTVFDGLKEFQKEQEAMVKAGADPESMAEMMSNNNKILRAANAWCMGAFIYPELKATKAEVTGTGQWYVDQVAAEDRIAIFTMCLDSDSPHLDKLKMFRPASNPVNALDDEAGKTAAAPERNLELVGAGV